MELTCGHPIFSVYVDAGVDSGQWQQVARSALATVGEEKGAVGGACGVDCVQAPLVIICKECRSALLVSANLSFAAAARCDVVVGSAARAGGAAWQVFFWLLAATTTATSAAAAAAWLLGLAFILLHPVGRWQSQQGMLSYTGVTYGATLVVIDHFFK